MPTTVQKNHIVSATYLRAFCVNHKLVRYRLGEACGDHRAPAEVGWLPNYWGRDRAFSDAVEQSFSRAESNFARLLRRFDDSWPLDDKGRATLAEFIALHVARSPVFRGF